MASILIIDDNEQTCRVLSKLCSRDGHDCSYALTLAQGFEQLSDQSFDLLFLDVNLPDGNGLQAIPIIKIQESSPEIIIMTGEGDPNGAELAIKSGVWDYLQKTSSYKEFSLSLNKALEYRKQKQSALALRKIKTNTIIGNSHLIQQSIKRVSKASKSDAPVLITGETGTGKELFAKAIHENSLRSKNGFIVVDCASLPEHLVESILFGHSKGAFTGADLDKAGLIKLADGGTLFLDEVGELPLSIQKTFLRALQEKQFRPVGSKQEVKSDFRLIAATHRDLLKMVEQGKLREDFYFRICSVKIQLPPLKDRKEDILSLVDHHLNRKRELFNELPHQMSKEFIDELETYPWPGNVRELLNAIDCACNEAYHEPILFPKHLPENIRTVNIKKRILPLDETTNPANQNTGQSIIPVDRVSLKAYIEETKQRYIQALMKHTNGDINVSCKLSGLSRGHLYALLKQYNIT